MKTNQDDLLKTVKKEMQATIGKMEAGIHSIQSELENTNQRMQNLHMELTETIERTQVELQSLPYPTRRARMEGSR
jgi:tRNA A37 threonylcarbamoyladenosine dehydratase